MTKLFSVRLRTFLIPIVVVCAYMGAQIVAQLIVMIGFSFGRSGQDVLYTTSAHMGSFAILVGLLVLFLIFIALFVGRRSLLPTFFFEKPTGMSLVGSPFITMGLLGLSQLYFLYLMAASYLMPWISTLMNDYSDMMDTKLEGIEVALYLVATCILIPIVEEFLFRGFVMGEFLKTMHPIFAIVLSSLVFGSMHIQPVQVGYAMACGIVMGTAYYLSKSMAVCCIIHMIFNFLGAGLSLLVSKDSIVFGFLALGYFLCIPLVFVFLWLMWREDKTRTKKKGFL